MHIENESAEIVTTGDHEFEEYDEEILVQEKVPEPPLTDSADTAFAQGKSWCITLIFYNHYMYICDVHLRYRNFIETTCIYIYIYPKILTSAGSSSFYA